MNLRERDSGAASDCSPNQNTEDSEHPALRQAMQDDAGLLQAIMQATDVMLVYLDPQFNFVAVNPAYAEGCRRTVEDLIGKNHFDLYPHPENQAIFRRVRDTGQAVFFKDKPFVFPDQPERGVTYWDWSLTPVKGADGAAVGLVLSLRETTRYKLAEEASLAINRIFGTALACDTEEELAGACLKTAEEITQSKFGFIGLLNAEGRVDAIAISDPGWKACRMEHTAGSRVRPKNFAIHGIYGRVLLDGQAFFTNDPANHPDAVGTPPGHPPLTSFIGVPLKQGGDVQGMIALGNREGGYGPAQLDAIETLAPAIIEVLKRQQAEQALHAGEERLREAQKMESIALLAGGVAHDFNNLLVGVIGNASLAAELAPPDSGIGELLERVVKSGEQAAHLTRQLLAYSGKGRFVPAPLDVSELVFEVTDLIRSTAPKKISIRLELAAGLPVITADRSQIYQVLMNLILNATEAIGRKAGSVAVKTGVLEAGRIRRRELAHLAPGRYAFLEVHDTGCGMDEATKARIFDPFFTTKFPGRGLGLAAVSGIVRGHQGSIMVDSTPGVGSTFTLYFPVTGEAALAPVAPRKAAFDGALRIEGAILVIDDEEAIRELVKSGLEHRNCTVLTAASGHEAIETLRRRADVRVAVLDLSMPGLSGEEVLPMLREINPALKVIVSSGYSKADVLRRFGGIPFDGFLQKPYTMQHLVETLQAVLIAEPLR